MLRRDCNMHKWRQRSLREAQVWTPKRALCLSRQSLLALNCSWVVEYQKTGSLCITPRRGHCLFFLFSVQRKSKRRLIRWSAHTGYQLLMTAPKCHTLMQSSMRFRDFQISPRLVCHTQSPKTQCSEDTCSPRWEKLWFLIATSWVSSTLLITNLTLFVVSQHSVFLRDWLFCMWVRVCEHLCILYLLLEHWGVPHPEFSSSWPTVLWTTRQLQSWALSGCQWDTEEKWSFSALLHRWDRPVIPFPDTRGQAHLETQTAIGSCSLSFSQLPCLNHPIHLATALWGESWTKESWSGGLFGGVFKSL